MPEPKKLSAEDHKKALQNLDWMQVVLNGGPPCFHLQSTACGPKFCLRAQLWDGHDDHHPYVPLSAYIESELSQLRREIAEAKRDSEGRTKLAEDIRRIIREAIEAAIEGEKQTI